MSQAGEGATTTFIDRLIRDGGDPSALFEEAVAEWHDSATGVPLHAYLGLTWDEYRAIIEHPSAIYAVLQAHLTPDPWLDEPLTVEEAAFASVHATKGEPW